MLRLNLSIIRHCSKHVEHSSFWTNIPLKHLRRNYGNFHIFLYVTTMYPVWKNLVVHVYFFLTTNIILDINHYTTQGYTYLHLEMCCWRLSHVDSIVLNTPYSLILHHFCIGQTKLLYNTLVGNIVYNHHMLNIYCVTFSVYVCLSIIGSLVWITCLRNE